MAEGWGGGIGKFPPNPKVKKMNFPRAAKPRVGNSIFFAEGLGGNFPITSSHIQAINIVLD